MKSNEEFLDGIYEKAKQKIEENKELPPKRIRMNQRKFIAAAAIICVLISIPMFYYNIFSGNGNTIDPVELLESDPQISLQSRAAKANIEENTKDGLVATFYNFYGTVIKIEEVSGEKTISFQVEVNPETGNTLFEGEIIYLMDINNLVEDSLIGSHLIFEVTQEGEKYQINKYILVGE